MNSKQLRSRIQGAREEIGDLLEQQRRLEKEIGDQIANGVQRLAPGSGYANDQRLQKFQDKQSELASARKTVETLKLEVSTLENRLPAQLEKETECEPEMQALAAENAAAHQQAEQAVRDMQDAAERLLEAFTRAKDAREISNRTSGRATQLANDGCGIDPNLPLLIMPTIGAIRDRLLKPVRFEMEALTRGPNHYIGAPMRRTQKV